MITETEAEKIRNKMDESEHFSEYISMIYKNMQLSRQAEKPRKSLRLGENPDANISHDIDDFNDLNYLYSQLVRRIGKNDKALKLSQKVVRLLPSRPVEVRDDDDFLTYEIELRRALSADAENIKKLKKKIEFCSKDEDIELYLEELFSKVYHPQTPGYIEKFNLWRNIAKLILSEKKEDQKQILKEMVTGDDLNNDGYLETIAQIVMNIKNELKSRKLKTTEIPSFVTRMIAKHSEQCIKYENYPLSSMLATYVWKNHLEEKEKIRLHRCDHDELRQHLTEDIFSSIVNANAIGMMLGRSISELNEVLENGRDLTFNESAEKEWQAIKELQYYGRRIDAFEMNEKICSTQLDRCNALYVIIFSQWIPTLKLTPADVDELISALNIMTEKDHPNLNAKQLEDKLETIITSRKRSDSQAEQPTIRELFQQETLENLMQNIFTLKITRDKRSGFAKPNEKFQNIIDLMVKTNKYNIQFKNDKLRKLLFAANILSRLQTIASAIEEILNKQNEAVLSFKYVKPNGEEMNEREKKCFLSNIPLPERDLYTLINDQLTLSENLTRFRTTIIYEDAQDALVLVCYFRYGFPSKKSWDEAYRKSISDSPLGLNLDQMVQKYYLMKKENSNFQKRLHHIVKIHEWLINNLPTQNNVSPEIYKDLYDWYSFVQKERYYLQSLSLYSRDHQKDGLGDDVVTRIKEIERKQQEREIKTCEVSKIEISFDAVINQCEIKMLNYLNNHHQIVISSEEMHKEKLIEKLKSLENRLNNPKVYRSILILCLISTFKFSDNQSEDDYQIFIALLYRIKNQYRDSLYFSDQLSEDLEAVLPVENEKTYLYPGAKFNYTFSIYLENFEQNFKKIYEKFNSTIMVNWRTELIEKYLKSVYKDFQMTTDQEKLHHCKERAIEGLKRILDDNASLFLIQKIRIELTHHYYAVFIGCTFAIKNCYDSSDLLEYHKNAKMVIKELNISEKEFYLHTSLKTMMLNKISHLVAKQQRNIYEKKEKLVQEINEIIEQQLTNNLNVNKAEKELKEYIFKLIFNYLDQHILFFKNGIETIKDIKAIDDNNSEKNAIYINKQYKMELLEKIKKNINHRVSEFRKEIIPFADIQQLPKILIELINKYKTHIDKTNLRKNIELFTKECLVSIENIEKKQENGKTKLNNAQQENINEIDFVSARYIVTSLQKASYERIMDRSDNSPRRILTPESPSPRDNENNNNSPRDQSTVDKSMISFS